MKFTFLDSTFYFILHTLFICPTKNFIRKILHFPYIHKILHFPYIHIYATCPVPQLHLQIEHTLAYCHC